MRPPAWPHPEPTRSDGGRYTTSWWLDQRWLQWLQKGLGCVVLLATQLLAPPLEAQSAARSRGQHHAKHMQAATPTKAVAEQAVLPRPVAPHGALGPVAALRGITVGPIESSQQAGRGYGTASSAALLDELVALGVNTISLTPFGRVWSLGSHSIQMDFEAPYEENREAIGRMVEQAHRRGLRVVLIPHLWVETGGWRGEMAPAGRKGWATYQDAYRRFVLSWARDAGRFGVDAFSIGVECTSFSGRFPRFWTRLIREVREQFPGPLTYSANWDEVDNVLFWRELDWIGVNAFYPLAKAGQTDYADYVAGAEAAIAKLERTAQIHNRPAVLMEIGYTTRPGAAVDPWSWPDHMSEVVVDEWEQARALAALMGAAARSPRIGGMLLWRYYAHLDDVSQEAPWGFSPHGKLAARVLQAVYAERWASDPPDLPWRRTTLSPQPRWASPFPTALQSFPRP